MPLLLLSGLLAGFIDSIAGGGGLITLPTFSLILGAGPHAIGTNKIAGTVAALVALLVYIRGGHMDWRKSLAFAAWVSLGSFIGSRLSPLLPVAAFKYFLFITCPIILWVVFRKDFWVARELAVHEHSTRWTNALSAPLILAGLGCGFYDGIWGPGGGTFMFLSLLFIARLPLFPALAAAKLANTVSAGTSLASYAWQGFVHWREGLILSSAIAVGAFIGAKQASKGGSKTVRVVLVFVVAILMFRLASQ